MRAREFFQGPNNTRVVHSTTSRRRPRRACRCVLSRCVAQHDEPDQTQLCVTLYVDVESAPSTNSHQAGIASPKGGVVSPASKTNRRIEQAKTLRYKKEARKRVLTAPMLSSSRSNLHSSSINAVFLPTKSDATQQTKHHTRGSTKARVRTRSPTAGAATRYNRSDKNSRPRRSKSSDGEAGRFCRAAVE